VVKGAATEASLFDRDRPTSASFNAAQSLAPSPHIPTFVKEEFIKEEFREWDWESE